MKRISVRVNTNLYNQISNIAETNNTTISRTARAIFNHYFNKTSPKNKKKITTNNTEIVIDGINNIQKTLDDELPIIKMALRVIGEVSPRSMDAIRKVFS